MEFRGRWILLAMITSLTLGGFAAIPRGTTAAEQQRTVMGIVDYIHGTVVTVSGKAYDLNGAPIRDAAGSAPVALSALRGSTVEILIRNRRIESVTVYRTLPQ